jgi:linoleoyl-CoA desaturase
MATQQKDGTAASNRPFRTETPNTLRFSANDELNRELRHRIDLYFTNTGLGRRDCPRMYLKTATILGWLLSSYVLLVFFAASWWLALPLAFSLGLAMAAVGFNIQHDGGHQAYSERDWINRLMARSLDLLGGSSYFWARKHNVMHHSHTNITGHDDDIDLGLFGRLSPHQKRLPYHRFQHVYLWALYGFLPIKWQVYDDFHDWAVGRIGNRRFERPKGWDLAIFLGGKLIFFSLAIAVPLLLHTWWAVLLLYLAASFVQGVTLSVVFQLAHCVEGTAFPLPRQDTGRMATGWAEHQVESTVDFARGNRLLSWFIGGLNFQIEHHLFPRICHVHYAAIAPIVEATCGDFGLRYAAHDTFRAGVASHYRWLRRMGRSSTPSL